MRIGNRFSAIALAVLLVTSMVAGAAGVVMASGGEINHDSDVAPNPEVSAIVQKDAHDMSWASPLTYENDNGDAVTPNWNVNETADNPYSYTASDVNFSDAGVFPTASSSVSMLEAAEWTADTSGSAGSASVSDVETAPGVDAVNLATSSQASGDTVTFTADNFSITSDENKRYLQMVLDVNTLDSGVNAEVQVVDSVLLALFSVEVPAETPRCATAAAVTRHRPHPRWWSSFAENGLDHVRCRRAALGRRLTDQQQNRTEYASSYRTRDSGVPRRRCRRTRGKIDC